MQLKDKTILIISQQPWGEMFISKHHYAVELAKLGNKVYYLDGPDQREQLAKGEVKVNKTHYEGLSLITHRLSFPYILKFKAKPVYDYLLRFHIKKILSRIGAVDIVWSFDLSDTIPLRLFPSTAKKIYMPVDELLPGVAAKAAQTADVIFSVTNEILQKFDAVNAPKVFLNHGVSEHFINQHIEEGRNEPIHVGLSGNFLRPEVDRPTLLNIIKQHPDIIFDFWGSTDYRTSNLVPVEESDGVVFINELKSQTNVKLHGQLPPAALAAALKKVDCFLICYDIQKDQSGGTNYHKILEYLSTGKVIISNNVTTYNSNRQLIEMTDKRDNNEELYDIFNTVIHNLDDYNNIEKQNMRIAFAKDHVYSKQIQKIASYL